jgi:hypothetical protein
MNNSENNKILRRQFRLKEVDPIIAFEFTKELHKQIKENVVKDEKLNPMKIDILDIPDAELLWNWHTCQLYIKTRIGFEQVNIGDFVLISDFEQVFRYMPIKKKALFAMYEEIKK